MDNETLWFLLSLGYMAACCAAAIKISFSTAPPNDFEEISISVVGEKVVKGKYFVIYLLCWIFLFAFSLAIFPSMNGALMTLLFLPPFIYFMSVYAQLRSGMIQSFAQENGLNYSRGGNLVRELFSDPLPPHLNIGHSHKISDVVYGIYNGNKIRFYNFTYTTGSGKNQSTHTVAVCEIDHATQTPHIDLEPRGWNFVPGAYDNFGMQELRLEGEFGDKYNFFVPQGFERQTLEIFTPDIMAEFLDMTVKKTPNFEFWNGKIIVSINWSLSNKKELRWMLQIGQWMRDKIVPKLDKLNN